MAAERALTPPNRSPAVRGAHYYCFMYAGVPTFLQFVVLTGLKTRITLKVHFVFLPPCEDFLDQISNSEISTQSRVVISSEFDVIH